MSPQRLFKELNAPMSKSNQNRQNKKFFISYLGKIF